jgi:hypothetical protein
MSQAPLPLLNVFEVEQEGRRRHLVCFLEVVLAGSVGIDDQSVIGEFSPGPDGEFGLETFEPNPGFIAAFTAYMNELVAIEPELLARARQSPGGKISLVDPRYDAAPAADAPPSEILGSFAIDLAGKIVPGSFQYNPLHQWFSPTRGTSGLLDDQRFYDWLHPKNAG